MDILDGNAFSIECQKPKLIKIDLNGQLNGLDSYNIFLNPTVIRRGLGNIVSTFSFRKHINLCSFSMLSMFLNPLYLKVWWVSDVKYCNQLQ